MEPTDCKSDIARVDRRVRLFKKNVPPMDPRLVLPRLVSPPALSQDKSPVICCGPSRLIIPLAEELITTLPEMVEQSANCVASACELIVAVG